ncbi:hypothetical protein LTR50_007889 [Elasticomyces elasticus]|nr:hypothetical protein LTR50_007889 [Elasticomyces elasticus]
MHFTKILSSILLAATASASPLGSRNVTLGKRDDSDGQAGAYITAGTDVAFAFVYGSPKMPDLSNAAPSTSVWYWIGIDGVNTNRVIQAGFIATKKSDGTVTYEAFYEWYPIPATPIPASDFTASAGDVVSITVAVTQTGTAATASFVNMNTDKSYNTPEFYSPDEDSDATGINAEWAIERAADGTTLANFGEVIFTDCSAADSGGYQYYLTGGTTLNMVVSGTTLATGTIVGDNEVWISDTQGLE